MDRVFGWSRRIPQRRWPNRVGARARGSRRAPVPAASWTDVTSNSPTRPTLRSDKHAFANLIQHRVRGQPSPRRLGTPAGSATRGGACGLLGRVGPLRPQLTQPEHDHERKRDGDYPVGKEPGGRPCIHCPDHRGKHDQKAAQKPLEAGVCRQAIAAAPENQAPEVANGKTSERQRSRSEILAEQADAECEQPGGAAEQPTEPSRSVPSKRADLTSGLHAGRHVFQVVANALAAVQRAPLRRTAAGRRCWRQSTSQRPPRSPAAASTNVGTETTAHHRGGPPRRATEVTVPCWAAESGR